MLQTSCLKRLQNISWTYKDLWNGIRLGTYIESCNDVSMKGIMTLVMKQTSLTLQAGRLQK